MAQGEAGIPAEDGAEHVVKDCRPIDPGHVHQPGLQSEGFEFGCSHQHAIFQPKVGTSNELTQELVLELLDLKSDDTEKEMCQ